MPAQLGMQNDVIRRDQARGHGPHDHLTRTAEARRRQAEAIANSVHRLWTSARRALERLINGKARKQTRAANGKPFSKTVGRADVAAALRRDLLRLARLLRRTILEPAVRRRRRRIAIARLRRLDDHLLADIGVTRGQIELVVDGMLVRRRESLSRPLGRAVPAEDTRDELPMAA